MGKRGIRVIGIIIVSMSFYGCTNVEFYQKGRLVDPIMVLDDDPTHVHITQKVTYSREGSVGGIGTGAGGGCGCY